MANAFRPVDRAELEHRLGYHRATADTVTAHQAIRAAAVEFGQVIVDTVPVPEGREKSLALTALQEAGMWANAGIACNLAPLSLGE